MMQSSCQQSCQKQEVQMPVVLMQAIKEDMERDFRNAETNPLTHSSYLRLQALKSRFWHVDDRLTCLLSLSMTDLTKFIPTLFHKVCMCICPFQISHPRI
jgi:secreted Zn-dependent insulinase-like peptidase